MNDQQSRLVLRAALPLIAILIAALTTAGAAWYRGWSDAHLPRMADQLGEVWMERAVRSERAGALDQARDQYERALAGDFHGAQNRNHCQKRLGIVLTALGRYAEALPLLQAAQASPHRSVNGYAPLVETLIALDRTEEARTVLEAWKEAAASTGTYPPPEVALGLGVNNGEIEAREALEDYLRSACPDANTANHWARLNAWTE